MRHVEMWSAVRQQGTVRASRKMCSRLKSSVTKSCKFNRRVKHKKQRIMSAEKEKQKKEKKKGKEASKECFHETAQKK